MNEPTPSWAERLILSNHQVADAIQAQAVSLNALAAAIAQLAESQIDNSSLDGGPPAGYLDGTL